MPRILLLLNPIRAEADRTVSGIVSKNIVSNLESLEGLDWVVISVRLLGVLLWNPFLEGDHDGSYHLEKDTSKLEILDSLSIFSEKELLPIRKRLVFSFKRYQIFFMIGFTSQGVKRSEPRKQNYLIWKKVNFWFAHLQSTIDLIKFLQS